MERRIHKRIRRRLKVRFGTEGFERVGFTSNLSVSGMFVASLPAPSLSTRLHFEISAPDMRTQYLEGVVQRIAHVDQALRSVIQGGFGVRFLSRGELFNEMNPKDRLGLDVTYPTQESFLKAFPELRVGGVFLKTTKTVIINSVVPVRFEMAWKGVTVELSCRVVHASAEGVGLVFVDASTALAQLWQGASKSPKST